VERSTEEKMVRMSTQGETDVQANEEFGDKVKGVATKVTKLVTRQFKEQFITCDKALISLVCKKDHKIDKKYLNTQ
jgi:hypothetical protein